MSAQRRSRLAHAESSEGCPGLVPNPAWTRSRHHLDAARAYQRQTRAAPGLGSEGIWPASPAAAYAGGAVGVVPRARRHGGSAHKVPGRIREQDKVNWHLSGQAACQVAAGLGSLPLATYRHGHGSAPGPQSTDPGAGRGGRLRRQRPAMGVRRCALQRRGAGVSARRRPRRAGLSAPGRRAPRGGSFSPALAYSSGRRGAHLHLPALAMVGTYAPGALGCADARRAAHGDRRAHGAARGCPHAAIPVHFPTPGRDMAHRPSPLNHVGTRPSR